MADSKISTLAAITTLGDADEMVVASSGTSKKITGANLRSGMGWALICDSVLGADTASFDTNTILGGNIPSTYKQLALHLMLRTDRAATFDNALLTFNNDTTAADYKSERLEGNAASASASEHLGTLTGIFFAQPPGATGPANSFGASIIDIPSYAATDKYKIAVANTTSYIDTGSGGIDVSRMGGVWLSTAAITRIAVTPNVGTNWKTGSRFTLYGLN